MARTRQTRHRRREPTAPGGISPITAILRDAHRLESLQVPKKTRTDATKRDLSSPARSDGTELYATEIGNLVAPFLDIASLRNVLRTNKMMQKHWRPNWEYAIVAFFLLTEDTQDASKHCVVGGWDTFIDFMGHVAIKVQHSFDALSLRPPPLYRALLAQQAIRRLDGSPHPCLWSRWGDETIETERTLLEWNYNCDEDDFSTTPQVPSVSLCFHPLPDEGGLVSEDGCMVLPEVNDIPELAQNSEVTSRLQGHIEWLADHTTTGSIRRSLSSEGRPSWIYLAKSGSDNYAAFWILRLDDLGQPHFDFFVKDWTADYSIEQPFGEVRVRSFFELFLGRLCESTWEWSLEAVDPLETLENACFLKGLGIVPFDELDVNAIRQSIQDEEAATARRRPRLVFGARGLDREVRMSYYAQMKRLPSGPFS